MTARDGDTTDDEEDGIIVERSDEAINALEAALSNTPRHLHSYVLLSVIRTATMHEIHHSTDPRQSGLVILRTLVDGLKTRGVAITLDDGNPDTPFANPERVH